MQSPDDTGTGKAARPARGRGPRRLATWRATQPRQRPGSPAWTAPPPGVGAGGGHDPGGRALEPAWDAIHLWNEAMSRTTLFLTVLSAAVVSLALVARATGFGHRTTTLALALLPVVLFLGVATHLRLVQINA
jgi:hypothetical protein